MTFLLKSLVNNYLLQYKSSLPIEIHEFLEKIPVPPFVPNWNQVCTEKINSSHLYWGVIFGATFWLFIRLVSYIIGLIVVKLTGIEKKIESPNEQQLLLLNILKNTSYNELPSLPRATKIKSKKLLLKHEKLKQKYDEKISQLSKKTDLPISEVQNICHLYLKNKKKIYKVQDILFEACAYGMLFMFGFYIVGLTSWAWDGSEIFGYFDKQTFSKDLRLYYLIELGLYLHLIVCHLTISRKLSDFWIMLTHHFSTITLLSTSYSWRYIRIGAVILLLHDAADPLLNWAKFWRNLKYERCTEIWFGLLLITWAVTRLYGLPAHCLYSIYYDHKRLTPKSEHYKGNFATVLLSILYVFHWFWYYLMLKVAYGSCTSDKGVYDSREEETTESSSDSD